MGRKITDEEIYEIVNKAGYKLNGIFAEGKRRMINVTCPNGHTYDKRLDGFKAGERCGECKRLPYNEVKRRFSEEGVELLANTYVDSKTKLHVKFVCGHEGYISLVNFMGGKRCPMCAGNKKHTYEKIKGIIEAEGYRLISTEYVNEATKLEIKCPKGHIFHAPYGSFRQGHRCPRCIVYRGEERVKKALDDMQINYIEQYKFSDCIYKKALSFDFYLPSINTCIEYDGIQHFEPRAFNSKSSECEVVEKFKEGVARDETKNTYCKNNNIKLIRIPYFEFDNIERVLKEKLNVA